MKERRVGVMMQIKNIITPPKDEFSGFHVDFDDAQYLILGFPFDSTSTYRHGSKLGPNRIRSASLNIETYSPRTGLFLEDIPLADLGDVKVTKSITESVKRLQTVVKHILRQRKMSIILGGEHTATYGAVATLPENAAIISFDAHFDLRNEYLGRKLSHATFMRRIAEEHDTSSLFFIGVRAMCKEEVSFIEKNKIKYIPSKYTLFEGGHKVIKTLRDFLSPYDSYYVSIDLDVLDPAQAPAVGNPEAEGISTVLLLDILQGIIDERLLGFDVTELAPQFDKGITAVQAAKIIFEIICFTEARKQHTLREPRGE